MNDLTDDKIDSFIPAYPAVFDPGRFGAAWSHSQVRAAIRAALAAQQPIDMVLHCPACGMQHIDAAEPTVEHEQCSAPEFTPWDNPSHKSHLCSSCGHIWRPADVPTNGVAAVKTKGKADSPIARPSQSPGEPSTDVDTLAQEIRRVDGSNTLGAGALAEALMSFVKAAEQSNLCTHTGGSAIQQRKEVSDAAAPGSEARSTGAPVTPEGRDSVTNAQGGQSAGEPVQFPSRRAVEREIEAAENPKGMHLNDGKERVILPGGTLRYMLALIDRLAPPKALVGLTDDEIVSVAHSIEDSEQADQRETSQFARAVIHTFAAKNNLPLAGVEEP